MQEEGLSEVHHMIDCDQPDADRKLRSVLEDLSTRCNKYLTIAKGKSTGSGVGKTKLDKERMKMCYRELVSNSESLRVKYRQMIMAYNTV